MTIDLDLLFWDGYYLVKLCFLAFIQSYHVTLQHERSFKKMKESIQ